MVVPVDKVASLLKKVQGKDFWGKLLGLPPRCTSSAHLVACMAMCCPSAANASLLHDSLVVQFEEDYLLSEPGGINGTSLD